MELEGNIRVFCRSRPILPVDGTDPDGIKVVVQCTPVGVTHDVASKMLLRGGGASSGSGIDSGSGASGGGASGRRSEQELKNVYLKYKDMSAAHYGRPVESSFEFDDIIDVIYLSS